MKNPLLSIGSFFWTFLYLWIQTQLVLLVPFQLESKTNSHTTSQKYFSIHQGKYFSHTPPSESLYKYFPKNNLPVDFLHGFKFYSEEFSVDFFTNSWKSTLINSFLNRELSKQILSLFYHFHSFG